MKKKIGTPQEIYEFISEELEKDSSEKLICYIGKKETKETRTIAQNRTFYKLFTDIGNYLGENVEDTKEMLLAGVFGTKTITVGKITKEVNIEKHTSKLSKEQGKKFIDAILAFAKKYDMGITITSRELQSLYDNYNI